MDETAPVDSALFGREPELRTMGTLLDGVNERGGSLTVSGGPGVGKSALLNAADTGASARGMQVLRVTGVQSEARLPFAALHRLLLPLLGQMEVLATPHRIAMLAAFRLSDAAVPTDLYMTALAALYLLADHAARAPVVIVADDAQWLDRSTCEVLAFLARRLEFEPILLIAAIRDGIENPLEAGLPVLHLKPLAPPAAAALLDHRAPDLPDVLRERFLEEAAGNPLALVELPIASGQLGSQAWLPGWLPLTTRLERAFAARVFDLPDATRTALLAAALNDGTLLSEVLDAASLMAAGAVTIDALAPAVSARLIEIDDAGFRFRHPLMRAAIRQEASIPQRHAAHAALAKVLAGQPDRAVWQRAAALVGPDEEVASELETAAVRAQQRGGTGFAVSALQRAAGLSEGQARVRRLLHAAELAFELGWRDLVVSLLAQAEQLDLRPSETVRLTWIRESFGDGIPGSAARVRSLAATAERAAADGDAHLALKLLNGAAQRCWWTDPGQAARASVVAVTERLNVDEKDPRLLMVLAFADPIGRGAVVIDRLSRVTPSAGSDTGATRLAGIAATAVGAFDLATGLLAVAVTGLRAQGRLGLLARALALQAWSAAHLADLGTAIPAAAEARRLAAETRQPLIEATATAVQAILAALHGDQEAAETLAASAERTSAPIGASATLAAAQLARGLAALSTGLAADAFEHLRRIHDPADPAYHAAIRCFTVGDLAEAAVRSGNTESIRVLVAEMETVAARTPAPLLHAGLRYARALLADDADAEALFNAALESELAGWPFLRARVQLAYGEWLHQRRRNAASRAPLQAARETFDALGTIPWSERARRQLRATGAASRPRVPEARDQLTAQELQIVQMAAKGLSNREIGQMLYLSHRTISSHLYRAFPKLGITSRAELPAVLTA